MLSVPLLAILLPAAADLTLVRGGEGDRDFRYWAVEDTFISSAEPMANFGRDGLLSGGPGKVILIRFGDLNRVVPKGKTIAQARLVLHREIGDEPKSVEVGRMMASWGEGPDRRGRLNRILEPEPGKGFPNAATWRFRRAGKLAAPWQTPGAAGSGDSKPFGTTVSNQGLDVIIEGLGEHFRQMLDRPFENFGLTLRFLQEVDFASSDSPKNQPKLELVLADHPTQGGPDLAVGAVIADFDQSGKHPTPGTPTSWRATITNVGDQPSQGGLVRWYDDKRIVAEVQLSGPIPAGESKVANCTLPFAGVRSDRRLSPLRVTVWALGPEANATNNSVEFDQASTAIQLDLPPQRTTEVARFMNEVLLSQSRFSFAPDGCLERVRYAGGSGPNAQGSELRKEILEALNLPAFAGGDDLFPGIGGFGDTRDEITFPNGLPMTYEPLPDRVTIGAAMSGTDLLSATEVGVLNNAVRLGTPSADWATFLPRTVMMRLLGPDGRPVPNTTFTLLKPTSIGAWQPVAEVRTGTQGSALLPSPADGPIFGANTSRIALRPKDSTGAEPGELRAWQVLDAGFRAGMGVATVNVIVPVAQGAIDRSANLALNKIISDSANSLPASLAAIVDDSLSTSAKLNLAPGGWIEIDLGRDRTIGEIRVAIKGESYWPTFDLMAYDTGQKPGEAALWAPEIAGGWRLKHRAKKEGDVSLIAYRGAPDRCRFIRLIVKSPAPTHVEVCDLSVFLAAELPTP